MRRALMAIPLAVLVLAVAVTGATGSGNQERARRERGDFQVGHEEVLRTNLVVTGGTLTVDGEVGGWVVVYEGDAIIRGTVRGHVIAVYGDVLVLGSGLIQGDAVSVSGNVRVRDQGVVTGSDISTTTRGLTRQGEEEWARIVRRAEVLDRERLRREESREPRWEEWDEDWPRRRRFGGYNFLQTGSFPLGGLVYNRVDGFTLQGEIFNSEYDWGTTGTSFYGGIGYAFASERFYYRAGLSRVFFPERPVEIGAGVYRQLETEDTWYMAPNENDWMAILARYDWYDYYLNRGFQVHVRIRPHPWISLGARYAQDTEESVLKETNWAIFGGDRDFRENVFFDRVLNDFREADEGEIRRLVYFGRLGRRSGNWRRPSRGVTLEGWFERAGETGISSGGDYLYERYLVQLNAYQRLSPIDHLAIRARLGAASNPIDDIPIQHRFFLGGVGSLRGYGFKEFTGNRFFLATAEYTLGTDSWTPIFDDWTVSLFYDYGLAWETDPGNGLYTDLLPEQGKRAVGIAISPFGWDEARFEIAHALDRADDEDDYVVYFRWRLDF